MKFRIPFLIIISLIHGYLLWSYSGLSHYWLIRGVPVNGVVPAACIFCLFGIIAVLFLFNFALTATGGKNRVRILLNSIGSFTVVHLLTILLTQLMDMSPGSQYYGYDALSYYKLNPIMLPVELIYLGLVAVVVTGTVLALLVGIEKVLDRSRGEV